MEGKEEMAEGADETGGKPSCVKCEGRAAKNLVSAGVKYLVRKPTKLLHLEAKPLKSWRILEVPMFRNVHLVPDILASVAAGGHSCCHKAGDRMISFLVNPERSFVGKHLLPFLPKTLRKDKIKEAHLTTPFR